MENKLIYKLLESLVKFDLLFFQSNKTLQKNRYCIKNLKFHRQKNANFLTLNPLELIKSLKRILRLLQFLSKQKNSSISLKFEKMYLQELLEFLVYKKHNIKSIIFLKDDKYVFSNQPIKSLFLFGFNNKKNIYNTLFQKKNFLISEINGFIQKNDFGTYKIFNDLDNWQKLVFFSLLLKSIYKKKKK